MTKDNSYRSPTTKDGTTSLPKYSPETLETTFQDFLESVGPGQCVYLATLPSGSLVDSRLVEGLMRKFMNQKRGLKKFADSCTYSVTTETVGPSQESGSEIMDDAVNHPEHYTKHPSGVECIQVTEHMGFCLGNAVKYLWRADLKGDAIVDLEKAIWYINREINKRKLAEDDV